MMAHVHPRKKRRKKQKEEQKRWRKKEKDWKPARLGQSGRGQKPKIKTFSYRGSTRHTRRIQRKRKRRKGW